MKNLSNLFKDSFSENPQISDVDVLLRNNDSFPENQFIKETFLGKNRWSIGVECLNRRDYLSFMSNMGLITYFPAMLVAIIEDLKKADYLADNILDLIEESLTGIWSEENSYWYEFSVWLNHLDGQQKLLIQKFCNFE